MLNDLFGIQSRGGCSCAGPYGHRLLGIDLDRRTSSNARSPVAAKASSPGWVRVNFNYFIDDDTFDYIVEAVALVADEGRRAVLPYYRFEPDTGLWHHRDGLAAAPLSLHDISYADSDHVVSTAARELLPDGGLLEYLDRARQLIAHLADTAPTPLGLPSTTDDFEHLRWFPYPDEA